MGNWFITYFSAKLETKAVTTSVEHIGKSLDQYLYVIGYKIKVIIRLVEMELDLWVRSIFPQSNLEYKNVAIRLFEIASIRKRLWLNSDRNFLMREICAIYHELIHPLNRLKVSLNINYILTICNYLLQIISYSLLAFTSDFLNGFFHINLIVFETGTIDFCFPYLKLQVSIKYY